MTKITAVATVYNEENRVGLWLKHAIQWADEVLIFGKCSTDRTREICVAAGARVETIPYSIAGSEDVPALIKQCQTEWCWAMTPGETPARRLVELVKALLLTPEANQIDIISIPIWFMSFGKKHVPRGQPWALRKR